MRKLFCLMADFVDRVWAMGGTFERSDRETAVTHVGFFNEIAHQGRLHTIRRSITFLAPCGPTFEAVGIWKSF